MNTWVDSIKLNPEIQHGFKYMLRAILLQKPPGKKIEIPININSLYLPPHSKCTLQVLLVPPKFQWIEILVKLNHRIHLTLWLCSNVAQNTSVALGEGKRVLLFWDSCQWCRSMGYAWEVLLNVEPSIQHCYTWSLTQMQFAILDPHGELFPLLQCMLTQTIMSCLMCFQTCPAHSNEKNNIRISLSSHHTVHLMRRLA
jgi:hypothetical protein